LRWRSPAKVNLCLRVVGRRDDGYHLLDSLFVPIDLCDDIAVTVAGVAADAAMSISARCDRDDVPSGGDNLVARAAAAVLAERRLGGTLHFEIAKRIPPGAGLGGGSGNAATVLRGLNEALALGVEGTRLAELALHLGADVPFFLRGRPARVRGIGERIEPVEPGGPLDDLALVVAIPPVAVATAWAFRAYAAAGAVPAPGHEAERLAAGARPTEDLLVNDLERVVLPAFPAVAELKAVLLRAGATAAVMSGSGSAVVGLAPSRAAAERIAADVRTALPRVQAHAVGIGG
jgi:4-diphosphocytidyl-2-C-methyl-D-erythritol kinase